MFRIIGSTGTSLLDVWTVVHVAFWLVVGANLQALSAVRDQVWRAESIVFGVLVGAIAWELVEGLLLEPAGYVRFPEIWYNRWVSDPLVGIFGAYLGMLLVRGR